MNTQVHYNYHHYSNHFGKDRAHYANPSHMGDDYRYLMNFQVDFNNEEQSNRRFINTDLSEDKLKVCLPNPNSFVKPTFDPLNQVVSSMNSVHIANAPSF